MNDETDTALVRKRRAFALLRDVLDLPDIGRTQSIADHCGDDAALALQVHALLAAERGSLLDGAASDIAVRLAEGDVAIDDLLPGPSCDHWVAAAWARCISPNAQAMAMCSRAH